MSSFVDLMANDVWTDFDITRRTEAMIRSEFPIENEMIINRKVLGASVGSYVLTEAEQAEVARYAAVAATAQAAGASARADMALLNQVFSLETAQRRLDRMSIIAAWDRLQQPELTPIIYDETGEIANAIEVEQDRSERQLATYVVESHTITNEDGIVSLNPEDVAVDETERDTAQEIIDTADSNVLAIFELRKNPRVVWA